LLFQLLKSKLKPSLHPLSAHLGLSSLILLHGTTGVGKGALLGAVARTLGIHFMQVCREAVVEGSFAFVKFIISSSFY
jgi:hypothetical protein